MTGEIFYMKLNRKGFTLIELLVVATISGILLIAGIAAYNNFNTNQTLAQVTSEVKTSLRLVQTRAFEGVKPEGCGKLTGWKIKLAETSYDLTAVCDGSELLSSEQGL